MNLAFLLPAGLAALAAVLLPLLIHLARRSEQRPTVFAALQWLRQKPKPRHRIRFDEWPLLLVRVLLVALVGVLLAKPVLFGAASHAPYVAVAPGVDAATAKRVDVPKEARWHWLKETDGPFTSVLRELDATLPPDVALTVIVPTQLDGVDAQIPKLTRKVDWRVVGSPSPSANRVVEKARQPTPLTIRFDPTHERAVRYLRAAAIAWNAKPDIAPATQRFDSRSRNVAWLATGAVPADLLEWTRTGGTLLLDSQATIADMPTLVPLWRDANGTVLIESAAFGRGRVLRFTKPLVPAQMPALLDGDFPKQLRAAIAPASTTPARVAAADHAPTTGATAYPPSARDIAQWLVLLIVLVFALERWMATARRSGVSP
ncbi:Membrane protein [Lysobacter dokdonensis DS-58]|uniref:Membrane protein n=1 Tax=Lysobacter dokdonensis DS-58 TaxID=1300345 RepID=A0A0A2WM43_9GAMM|nr:BatA domain-containing protein [Lysobacter dokdonensis]KGQ19355.1 Membrane protein [Lysobacter dokdonensis DS-58]